MVQVPRIQLKGIMRPSLTEAEQQRDEMLQAELYTVGKAEEPLI